MRDFFESLGDLIGSFLGIIFMIGFVIASPGTFVYLIMQDAETSHSFFKWAWLILLDTAIAGSWFVYWPIHWLFGW
jgi:hypothetical protein